MRLSIDVGGTFTDLVILDDASGSGMFKAPTTPADPIEGVLAAISLAAASLRLTTAQLLGRTEILFHSTTRAINAVVTGRTARTALLATEGHPDVLLLREGGRSNVFDYSVPYPEPYIPRSLTFELPGRIWADGRELTPLDEAKVKDVIAALRERDIEAVAVALIWSIVNPAHELRVGALLRDHLPGIPFTLSHQLNPTIREYRRTSASCIDASLKPVMTDYLQRLERRLSEDGLDGQVFAVTSQGGLTSLMDLAERPILALNSGPAMAPVAGRHFAGTRASEAVIVADAGGTTYDVSLVVKGVIPWTRETWLGPVYRGHLTGFPSVDVKSIGAGGGSIVTVGSNGLLRVGPESAGATPGPVCYGHGGERPTVTDAAVALGWIDPGYFLGGRMALDVEAARAALRRDIALPLGIGLEEAAHSVIELATEQMVGATEDITVKQGIDPEGTVMIAGGGAAGLNAAMVARRLRCRTVIIPDAGAALSAVGAMMSELTRDFTATLFMPTIRFDTARANAVIAELVARARAAFAGYAPECRVDLSIEARYPSQVWEVEVPLRQSVFTGPDDVATLVADFHARHTELFSFRDDGDEIDIMTWRAVARCPVADASDARAARSPGPATAPGQRRMFFPALGLIDAPVYPLDSMEEEQDVIGPGVIESSFTTVVVPPGVTVRRRTADLLIDLRR